MYTEKFLLDSATTVTVKLDKNRKVIKAITVNGIDALSVLGEYRYNSTYRSIYFLLHDHNTQLVKLEDGAILARL